MQIRFRAGVRGLERCSAPRMQQGLVSDQGRPVRLQVPIWSTNSCNADELHSTAQNHGLANCVTAAVGCGDHSQSEH